MLPLDEAGFLPTNDSGYLTPDGYLIFTGRLDRLIKSAGANISPIELEEHIQRWGRIGTCAVVGVPHPTLGSAVVLCAVRDTGGSQAMVSEEDVKTYLRARVAAYKVPREVIFFAEDEMPLTISSKVQTPEMTQLAVVRLLERDIDSAWRQILIGSFVELPSGFSAVGRGSVRRAHCAGSVRYPHRSWRPGSTGSRRTSRLGHQPAAGPPSPPSRCGAGPARYAPSGACQRSPPDPEVAQDAWQDCARRERGAPLHRQPTVTAPVGLRNYRTVLGL